MSPCPDTALRCQIETPYGYDYEIVEELNPKKLSIQEKVKVAKPGLYIMAELEKLAAEAKEKGGAEVRDESYTGRADSILSVLSASLFCFCSCALSHWSYLGSTVTL